ncbi:unnamed protein product [Sphagnum troendelagicum]
MVKRLPACLPASAPPPLILPLISVRFGLPSSLRISSKSESDGCSRRSLWKFADDPRRNRFDRPRERVSDSSLESVAVSTVVCSGLLLPSPIARYLP